MTTKQLAAVIKLLEKVSAITVRVDKIETEYLIINLGGEQPKK